MSALAIVLHRDGAPAQGTARLVEAMLSAVPHRGPDGTGVRVSGPVALGHAAFSVTPEDVLEQRSGGQPLVHPDSGCVIVADARLDNRDALRETLLPLRPAIPLPSLVGDAALILCAYLAWGEGAFARLLGDFALAIWDSRRQRLVCARDTSGQRSLYYHASARTFAAASEIHQLFQDPAVPVEPNDARIQDWLAPLNVFRNEQDHRATFYEGIASLPAGHVLTVESSTLRLRRFWEMAVPAELRYRRGEEYADHFRSVLSDVLRPRLRAAYPIGAFLSGGLDSSSVVCAAHDLYRRGQALDHGFTTFSSVFDGLECDERELIREVETKTGFAARYVSGGSFGGRLQLEPQGFIEAPNMGIPEARDALFKVVEDSGVRAVLTGDLADSCVGGSWQVFDSLLRAADLGAFARYWQAYHRLPGASQRKTVIFGCVLPFMPVVVQQLALYAYIRHAFRRCRAQLLPDWMPAALRSRLADRHLELMLEAERGRRFKRAAHEAEYRALYPPEVARHPSPWSVEIWRPFADRRLHEFLLAVPPEKKFAPHEEGTFYAGSKRVLREAMRGILPERIRTRTAKTVFGAVHRSELASRWRDYETAFGPGGRSEVAARGYVEPDHFWRRLISARDGDGGRDMAYVMQVVALESWFRTFALPRSRLRSVRPPWQVTHSSGNGPSRAINKPRLPADAPTGQSAMDTEGDRWSAQPSSARVPAGTSSGV